MDWESFVVGFFSGIVSGVIVGILVYEYKCYRAKKQEEKSARKQWNTDLSYEITSFCDNWRLFKGCNTPGVELRKELIAQARDITVRSSSEFIKPSRQRTIKKPTNAFPKESRKLQNADDETWSNHVLKEVDAICTHLLKIAGVLRG